jgi:hypothetical protein
MNEREFAISKWEFRGEVLWDRTYSADSGQDTRPFRLLIVQVATDYPIIDRHEVSRAAAHDRPTKDRVSGPGGYVVAVFEHGHPTFTLPYETRSDLFEGNDGLRHESYAHVRAALDDALRQLFPEQQ